MKTLSYQAQITERRTGRTWWEKFTAEVVDNNMTPLQHATFLMKRYNDTLREGRYRRTVLSVRAIPQSDVPRHDWKKTSPKTFRNQLGTFLKYHCERCPATGKRYGTISFITPDSSYTEFCQIAVEKRKRTT